MTAVVFGVIVVMWAVVLIPMWLRRHDETEETRSVDRFSQAMHTLSRRESASKEKKYVVMPTRTRSHEVHVSGAAADGRRSPRRRPATTSAVTAATRRRRTLGGLLGVTLLTLVLAVFLGGLDMWALNVIVDAVLLAFVYHLRGRARHAALIRPSRRPVAGYTAPRAAAVADQASYAAPQVDEDEWFEPVPVRAQRPAPVLFDQTALDEPVIEFELEEAAAMAAATAGRDAVFDQTEEFALVAATRGPSYDESGRDTEIDIPIGEPAVATKRAAAGDIGARPWEPVPVPKPIYASKPAAPARPKRAAVFEPLLPPVEPAELDPVEDLEEILDRRWAVND